MSESENPGAALADAIYKDAARSLDERTDDLLVRMTLEEKVAQMLGIWQQKPTTLTDAAGNFDLAKASAHFASEAHSRLAEGALRIGEPGTAKYGAERARRAGTSSPLARADGSAA